MARHCVALALALPALAQKWKCEHCKMSDAFNDLTKTEKAQEQGPNSSAYHLWATHIEVVHLDENDGGFLPPSFHKRLADTAIKGWANFRDEIVPGLSGGHPLREQRFQSHAGALNDAFFIYQKNLFEQDGHLNDALDPKIVERGARPGVGTPGHNSSWPDMDALPEYQMLRKIVDRLSRRYLRRSGLDYKESEDLKYSIFNWCAINSPGEFHGPHTHLGEYHVGVFYAQVGTGAGQIRFGDPRGTQPPFGSEFSYSPKSGDFVIFPSWLKHMATVTAPEADPFRADRGADTEPLRVIFSFNIGPEYGPMPCWQWWSDPTGVTNFKATDPIDVKQMTK